MKIIESNKQPVSISDYLTKQVGERKQTAASFAENILKRHRHRLAAPKLLSLVYLLFVRLNILKRAANRPGSIKFKHILNQTHGHTGSIYQKNTRIFKQRIRKIRQIINLTSAGSEHSNHGSHLTAKASIEPKSVWTGLQLSSEYPAAKIISLFDRQFEIRRTSQPPGYLSKSFFTYANLLNAAIDARKYSDPDSPLQQGGSFAHRLMQNNLYRNGRISSIQVNRDQRIMPGHAKPIVNRVKKNMGAGSFTESAVRIFLKGSPTINNLKRKWNTLISVSKSETKKAGTMTPNQARGLFIQRPISKAPVSPVRERTHSARTGRLFTTGSESKAEEHMSKITWSAQDHHSQKKEKIYQATKNRLRTEIKANRLVMKRRSGILELKISPAVNPSLSEVNSVHPTGSQNLFDQPLITATRHRLVNRIVQKQQRVSRNTQFHEHLQSMTKIPVSSFQLADSNRSSSPTVRLMPNESYSLPVFPMSNQFNRNPEILPIASSPLNQNFGERENEQLAPAISHPVKVLEQPGLFRQPSLRYRRSRAENYQLPGRAPPGGPAAMPIITESGSGATGSRQLPSEMDQRTGQHASETSYLSQGQKEAVREYLNRMPRQEVNLVADKVYDLIEKRLSIEQERRGWA